MAKVLGLCTLCNKIKKVRPRRKLNGALGCDSCYKKHLREKEICIVCGENRVPESRDENGNAICKRCYDKAYVPPQEICIIICKELGPVAKRDENKNPICHGCYNSEYERKIEICIICNESGPVAERDENKNAICKRCCDAKYVRLIEICTVCKRNREVHSRDEDGGAICGGCHVRPIEICIVCGESREVHARDENKNAICERCYEPPLEICSICKENRPVGKRNEDGSPVCDGCYRTPSEICIVCGEFRPVCIRDDDRKAICAGCRAAERYENDEIFHIKTTLRRRLKTAFDQFSKNGKIKTANEYGIDYELIVKHLGYCPGNREDYHIDHIFPISAFNFDNSDHIRAAFAPENHQWLLVQENLTKSDKYDKEEFEKYLEKFINENR